MMRFFSRRRRDEELDDEIRTHLSMAIQDRVARGESRHDAERAARRATMQSSRHGESSGTSHT